MDLHNKVRRKSDICGVKDLIDERETKLTRLQHKMDKEEKERSEREVELTEKLAEAETRIVNLKRSIEGHNHNVSELIRTTQDEVSWSESVSGIAQRSFLSPALQQDARARTPGKEGNGP